MISEQAFEFPQSFPAPLWQPAGVLGKLGTPQVDSETAALFRAVLRPLIAQSVSWSSLMEALRLKGYGLAFRDGRLFLINHETGKRVCSLQFLGIPLCDLVERLGRPIVRALPGRRADGILMQKPSEAHSH